MSEAAGATPAILVAPTAPRQALPPGACDCHAHLFGPLDRFPPVDRHAKSVPAPLDAYRAMLTRVGFARAVIVQPAAYEHDHRLLLSALDSDRRRFRGVAVKDVEASDTELADLHARGVRGLRFNEIVGPGKAVGLAALKALAPRLRALGWHAQLYALCERIAELLPELLSLRIPLVIDHIARVGPSDRTVEDPSFKALLAALRDNAVWVKLTAYRNARTPQSIGDLRPFHEALLQANPDRLVWGSDWPYLSRIGDPPDTGALIDVFDDWTGDATLRRKILVDNPAALYGF